VATGSGADPSDVELEEFFLKVGIELHERVRPVAAIFLPHPNHNRQHRSMEFRQRETGFAGRNDARGDIPFSNRHSR